MDTVHVIRHKHFIEKQSVRRIAREMGLNRRTVRRYLRKSKPERKESGIRPVPVMGTVGPRIESLLEEWTPRLEGKHRLTSPRVHRQLIEEGLCVGERTVRRYLAERRRQGAEVYIPLVHRPGDEAQADFFEVAVDEAGERRAAWKFLLRLMYSGRDFVWLYRHADQVAFLDGHVRAFQHFGGVVHRVVYDNLKSAVKRIVGLGERELSERFLALSSHYLFEPCFARPGEGHDKGGVESRGKAIRLQHLTPIVEGPDLPTISTRLLGEVDQQWRDRKRDDGKAGCDLFVEESASFRPLPATPFEPRRPEPISISNRSLGRVLGAEYSLPSSWARLDAVAWVGPLDIRFVCRDQEAILPRIERGQREVRYRHYVKELARKPQAVRQVAPELIAELGEPYRRLWQLLEKTHGAKKGARVLAGLLGVMDVQGERRITEALRDALENGRIEGKGPANGLKGGDRAPIRSVLDETQVPMSLRTLDIQAGCAADYDLLLTGGLS